MKKHLQNAVQGNGWIVMALVAVIVGAAFLTGTLALPSF